MCSLSLAFLWSGPVLSTQKAKVAWVDVCMPKDEGELGLKNLTEMNKVSSLKLIWCILSARSSLWVKWIGNISLGKVLSGVLRKSNLGSCMWKKLLKLRPLVMQMLQKEINSGSTTSFWYEKWPALGQLIELTGERGCMDLGIPINSTVENAVQLYRGRRHRVHNLQLIGQEIIALKNRGLNQQEDICLWKRENGDFKSEFSTSQTWNLTRHKLQKVSWYKGVLFSEATPRFSFFAWLAILNRLATGDRMIRWNPQAISTCGLCNLTTETRDHLFFECCYSKEVWIGTIKNLAGSGSIYRCRL